MEEPLIFKTDCDYINGENYDHIQYDCCIQCYRYETCKAAFEKENHSVT